MFAFFSLSIIAPIYYVIICDTIVQSWYSGNNRDSSLKGTHFECVHE
jgi:hypothetical protein